ncbi:MAG TPA: TetR/AcrR family transcriptional regulator [Acidimicrobiales bacterium]|nr:TetR/AcrR family transcriptional regulator [Acidimicrobiales bacterium]
MRAAALPPDERRAAIVAAAMPLVLARGTTITTKQIAEAAGIAEGTIFRVFPDKESLLEAVLEAALDTSAAEHAISTIDRSLPFEEQLEIAVEVMQTRVAEVWRLVSAVAESHAVPHRGGPPRPVDMPALADLCAASPGSLRDDPVRAARILRSLTLAVSHPALYPDDPLPPRQIVDLFLHGVGCDAGSRAVAPRGRRPRKGAQC